MEPISLNFAVLLSYLHQAIAEIKDPRKVSNSTRYSLKDALLAAFSVFFMQCDSFLEHQRRMHTLRGQDNAQSLFGLQRIPSVPQIRNILDRLSVKGLLPVFRWVYQGLVQGGYLKAYQHIGGDLLVSLDGTQYFSSQKIHCPCCSSRTHRNGSITYFHSAILPVIVSPHHSEVLSLPPEFLTPQDGSEKQDCEVAAAKRWIESHGSTFLGLGVTLLGDDLYSHQPLCETVLAAGMNFIFTCLPESHSTLYQKVKELEENGLIETLTVLQTRKGSQESAHYRYVNEIPLRETQPVLLVNWCEVEVTRNSDGKRLYHNTFITRHPLNPESVPLVVEGGRSRWKTENENHNVLKTKGYHLEHNFGHGQHHLASVLLTLNILAFLFHTVLQLVDPSYQQIRHKRGTRKGFFQDILTLTQYFLFESWQHLINFMLSGFSPSLLADSS